jgi:DNA processing protein
MDKTRFLLALLRTQGVSASQLKAWLQDPQLCPLKQMQTDWACVETDLAWLNAAANRFIFDFSDPIYPEILREIPGAPPILLAEGDLSLLKTPQLAIVGSRNPSRYGMSLAQDFSKALSQRGLTITSGLALGIDGAAHRGALAGSGRTIAVLGAGIDRIYPQSHRSLAEDILSAGGLILSEFPLSTEPLGWHFPKRNRIISGLSQGTLVVEATLGSGSLKTAAYAIQQGREVFAIPGSIHSPLSRGCHSLIQQGAKLINDVEDILSELKNFFSLMPPSPPKTPTATQQPLEISPLLRYIGYECTSLDRLLAETGLDMGHMSAGLLELELQGYIAGVPGGYVRTSTAP